MPYGSVEAVRDFTRGIDASQVPDDQIERYLALVEPIIDQATGQSWGKTTTTEYYDGNTKKSLVLRNWPVLALTSVEKRNDEGTAFETLTVYDPATNEGDYWLEKQKAGIVLWTSEERPRTGQLAIKITYDYGYDPTPKNIDALASMLAAVYTLAYAAGIASPQGLVSIAEGALSLSWGGGPFQETVALLERQIKDVYATIGRRMNAKPSYATRRL